MPFCSSGYSGAAPLLAGFHVVPLPDVPHDSVQPLRRSRASRSTSVINSQNCAGVVHLLVVVSDLGLLVLGGVGEALPEAVV